MRGDTPPPPGPVIVDVGTAQARQIGPGGRLLPAFLPGLATTAALLVSGRLLSRDDVRAWTASRTWGL